LERDSSKLSVGLLFCSLSQYFLMTRGKSSPSVRNEIPSIHRIDHEEQDWRIFTVKELQASSMHGFSKTHFKIK